MAKATRRGQKRCPACDTWVKGTRTKTCPKCSFDFPAKQDAPAAEPVQVVPEKPAKAGDSITLEQISAVTQTIKAVGGIDRLNQMLAVIKDVGGLRRFRDLLEAMSLADATEADA